MFYFEKKRFEATEATAEPEHAEDICRNDSSACDNSRVIATYKEGSVTETEFIKYLNALVVTQPMYEQSIEEPEFRKLLLEQYIAYKVLGSRASIEAIEKAEEDARVQINNYKGALSANTGLQAVVQKRELSDEDMERFVLLTSTVVAHINSMVTDTALKAVAKELEADFGVYSVRHIMVSTTERDPTTGESKEIRTLDEAFGRAKEVKTKLEAGGDWGALAKEYSDDGGSKENGGLYENVRGGDWIESFKLAAYEQEISVIGEPVQSEFGYHVMLVEKRDIRAYSELSEQEQEMIKDEAALRYMDQYKEEAMPSLEITITN